MSASPTLEERAARRALRLAEQERDERECLIANAFDDAFIFAGKGLALGAHHPNAPTHVVLAALARRPETLTRVVSDLGGMVEPKLVFVGKNGRWRLGDAEGFGVGAGLGLQMGTRQDEFAALLVYAAIGKGIALGMAFGVEHASEVLRLPGAAP